MTLRNCTLADIMPIYWSGGDFYIMFFSRTLNLIYLHNMCLLSSIYANCGFCYLRTLFLAYFIFNSILGEFCGDSYPFSFNFFTSAALLPACSGSRRDPVC